MSKIFFVEVRRFALFKTDEALDSRDVCSKQKKQKRKFRTHNLVHSQNKQRANSQKDYKNNKNFYLQPENEYLDQCNTFSKSRNDLQERGFDILPDLGKLGKETESTQTTNFSTEISQLILKTVFFTLTLISEYGNF